LPEKVENHNRMTQIKKSIIFLGVLLVFAISFSSCRALRNGGGHEACPAYGDLKNTDQNTIISAQEVI